MKYLEHGRRKGGQGGPWPHWILKLLAKKGCFFNFERHDLEHHNQILTN